MAATPSRAGVSALELAAIRRLATACLVSCLLFLFTAGWLQWQRSDLDLVQHTLSFYLHGPGGLWLCLVYVLLGVVMAGMGYVLQRTAPAPSTSGALVMACLGLAGIGLAAVAIGDRLSPPLELSRPGWFHYSAAYVAFAAALVALPLQALRFAAARHWRGWALPTGICAALCWLLAMIHIGRLDWLPRGVGQKLLIAVLVSSMVLISLAVLRHARPRPAAPDAISPSIPPTETAVMIERFDCGPRLAEMTVHNGVAYLAGQIPEDTSADITGQTAQVLAEIDALLARAGTSKQNILRAEIFLADINDAPGMNVAWDAWVPAGHAPARATMEARLVNKDWKVEIVITAAIV